MSGVPFRRKLDSAHVAFFRVNPPNVAQTRMLCDDHDAMEAEIASLHAQLATAKRESLSECSLGALQMELHQRSLKVLGYPWESFQVSVMPPEPDR